MKICIYDMIGATEDLCENCTFKYNCDYLEDIETAFDYYETIFGVNINYDHGLLFKELIL